jgi:NTE family protein
VSNSPTARPRIGLALGSGAARGWAHIGVLAGLAEEGIEPDIVCGTSIGALVGGLYCAGRLDELETWVCRLTRRDVVAHMDFTLAGGGVIGGRRLMDLYSQRLGDLAIEELPKRYAAVATDLSSGAEVWLQKGPLLTAIRASISLPGLFTPVRSDGRWLVDGGLVNPVPVSVCRALGADVVIAVNLNGDLLGRHRRRQPAPGEEALISDARWLSKLAESLKIPRVRLQEELEGVISAPPFFQVLSSSLNIMQDRITRSRLAGEPPDLVLAPRLAHFELLDFARAPEAIKAGRVSVRRMAPALQDLLQLAVMPARDAYAPTDAS